jgi:hypothetical protein
MMRVNVVRCLVVGLACLVVTTILPLVHAWLAAEGPDWLTAKEPGKVQDPLGVSMILLGLLAGTVGIVLLILSLESWPGYDEKPGLEWDCEGE